MPAYIQTRKDFRLTRARKFTTIGCGYSWTVTADGFSHVAFRTREALVRWMHDRALWVLDDIGYPELDGPASFDILGTYHTAAHMDVAEFAALVGVHTRALSNGEWTEAVITADAHGRRTVHTLNPNVRERRVFDYRASEAAHDAGEF